jgi:LPPG:FO 2-phospho-L-lactate transferase
VSSKAFSGPAAEYMQAAGIEVSPYGIAQMYSDVCSNIVIDSKDRLLTKKIQNLDMKVYDTNIKMNNKIAEDALASFVLKNVRV